MKKEKIFTIIVFIVVLFIPLIYSFFYLKSYWNPYGNLSDMKIAVVNMDKGSDNENQGEEFVKSLQDSNTFDIKVVTEDEAEDGMKKGDYYATIKIPENFTECLESASSEDKQIANITYSPNQATNYLATQIVNSAVKTIELNLQSKVDKQIIAQLSDKLNEVPDSLQNISDGADTILNGTESLDSGINQISDGTNQLSSSYNEFNTGVQSAYSGSENLQSGISQVSGGIPELQSGVQKLGGAIDQINAGIDEMSVNGMTETSKLINGVNTLNTSVQALNSLATTGSNTAASLSSDASKYLTDVNSLCSDIATLANSSDPAVANAAREIMNKDSYKNIVNSSTKVATEVATLSQVNSGIAQYAAGIANGTSELLQKTGSITKMLQNVQGLKSALEGVKAGTDSLNDGITLLQAGTNKLSVGSTSLTTGLEKLSTSSNQINTAIDTLNTGVESASDGSAQLVSGVQTYKTAIDEGLEDTKEQLKSLDGIDEFGEKPVTFETEEYGKVDSYGIAFTPLFLCIGLWVGALMCYVVLYYDHDERFGILGMTNKNKLLQNILYIGLGAVEGLLTGMLLKMSLGYTVDNAILYYGASILIGVTFMSIIQFLIRNFEDIGKFLALIVLVLQLAAAGGTFPIETIDKGFQAISPYLPMTYSIKLLREILVPTATDYKGMYIGILLAISISLFAITQIVDICKERKLKEKEN